MKPIYHLLTLLLCSDASLLASTPQWSASSDGVVNTAQQQLVEQLGSNNYSDRELATQTIWELGSEMLPYLQRMSRSDDPELASRVAMLIQNIEAGIFPTTNKDVLRAIAKYNNSNSFHAKLDALESLTELKANKQALYLLRNEKDAEVRVQLSQDRNIRQLALTSAHAEVIKGELDEAISILRLAPNEVFNLRALAHLLKQTGKLEEELEALKGLEVNGERQLWKLTLLQSKGDLAELKAFAVEEGLSSVLSVVAMVEGNPHLIINELIERSHEELHTKALKTLKDTFQKNTTQHAKGFANSLEDSEDETLTLYQSSLAMLMGQRTTGESLLERANPIYAVEYYKSLESSTQELRMLGCPDPRLDSASFKKWVLQQITLELDLDKNHLDTESVNKIEQLAKFFHQRGLLEEASFIYQEYLQELKESDNERWRDVLASMPEYGMSELMLKIIDGESLGDKELASLADRLFGETPHVDILWEVLAQHNQGKAEQFQEFCSLMSIPSSSSNTVAVEKKIVEMANRADASERIEILEALAYAAERRGDYQSTLQYYKQLCALAPKVSSYISKYRETAELQMDWEEIIASCDLNPIVIQRNPVILTRYAIAHRKLGKENEYEKLMRRAYTHSLGMAKTLNSIATVLHEYGYADEALDIWMHNLISFSSIDWEFYMALTHINTLSHELINQQEWKKASALSIVEAAAYMDPSAHPLKSAVQPLRLGFSAYFTYGMALLENGRQEQAVEFLEYAHSSLMGDGLLANHFFPSLLRVELKQKREQWLRLSWEKLEREISDYPDAHNTHNTIAWLGSRAAFNLAESKRHSEIALRIQPNQPAYLDTLAEVHFAMNDRKSAVDISNKALNSLTTTAGEYKRRANLNIQYAIVSGMFWDLSHQHARFEYSPLPVSLIKD